MLKSIRLKETEGAREALRFATGVTQKYWDRVPLALVSAVCVESWLRRTEGIETSPNIVAVQQNLLRAVPGRKALYRAIGLLD
jgi:hypothetical protein